MSDAGAAWPNIPPFCLTLRVPFSLSLSSRATTEGEDIFCPFARRAIESGTEREKEKGLFIVLPPSSLPPSFLAFSLRLRGGRRLDRLNKCN